MSMDKKFPDVNFDCVQDLEMSLWDIYCRAGLSENSVKTNSRESLWRAGSLRWDQRRFRR